MEEPIITGVATDLSEAKITVVGVPDVPGKAAQIFTIVAGTNANIDMIVQNVSAASTRRHRHLVHAADKSDAPRTCSPRSRPRRPRSGSRSLQYDDQIGKLSVVGGGHALERRASRPGCSTALLRGRASTSR